MRHRYPSQTEARATPFLPQQHGTRGANGLPPIQGPHVSIATYSAHCWEGLRLPALSWRGLSLHQASLVPETVKSQPAMQETQVCSLGWEDPLEKGMATHSSILAWRIPWTEEPGGLQSMGLQRVRHPSSTNTFTFTFYSLHHHVHCSAAWLLGLSKQKAGSVPGAWTC